MTVGRTDILCFVLDVLDSFAAVVLAYFLTYLIFRQAFIIVYSE